MGWLPLWARLASVAPGTVNAILRRPAVARAVKRAGGIALERDLPAFARALRVPAATGARRVVLWPDTFTRYFAPEVGLAAVDVLRAAGYAVEVPRAAGCCGLTLVATGQLGLARRVMGRTARILAPYAAAGVPIVGLEPSCTATLRTDLPELLPAAEPIAAAVRTLAEVLAGTDLGWLPAGALAGRPAVGQVHCHQSSVLGGAGPDAALLAHVGVRAELVAGCCGLAGSFGFERGHYAVSQAVAEDRLYPALRAAGPDTLVLADGFSCRTQIGQGTGRPARHLAEVLRTALDPSYGLDPS